MDYLKDIEIDESALDLEVLNQAKLGLKYGLYYAECLRKVTQVVENLKLIKAQLTNEAILNPEECIAEGVSKPTAVMIEAYFREHPKHKEAKEIWEKAKHELEIAIIAKSEICYTRKAMLENLIKLSGQSYFAGPSVPRDLSYEAALRKDQTRVDNKVAKKLKRKKK